MPGEATTAASEAVASGTALRYFGAPIVASALAIAIGFTVMWPQSKREGFQRMACTLIASFFFGPLLVIGLHAVFPALFASAKALCLENGIDPAIGMFYIATPVLVLPGLVAWWVFGAIVEWFARRRGMAIDEMAKDAAKTIKQVKESI